MKHWADQEASPRQMGMNFVASQPALGYTLQLPVEEGHQRATDILTGMRTTLAAMAALLNEKEVISGDEVKQVIAGEGAG